MINQEEVYRQAEARFNKREANREENTKQLNNLRTGEEFEWTKVESATRLAERARLMGLFEEAGALLREPTDIEIGKRVFEQIIDANNLLSITFLFEGANMARAVGRITLPMSGGTRMGTGVILEDPEGIFTSASALWVYPFSDRSPLDWALFPGRQGTRFNSDAAKQMLILALPGAEGRRH